MHKNLPHILFCGDPHGRFDQVYDASTRYRPDAIVLLGDIGPTAPLSELMSPVLEAGVQVCWIPGNHDTDNEQEYDWLYSDRQTPGLHCIHGAVHVVRGKNGAQLRLAGLGGIFRGKAWAPPGFVGGVCPEYGLTSHEYLSRMGKGNRWRGGLPLRHRSTIFADQWLSLAQLRADVLVTHEAPAFHENGFAVLHQLAVMMGVTRSFHGHHHQNFDYGQHDGVHAFGVGIHGIMDLWGEVL